jgi:predicted NUDIX family NTP pyrophosphohydrolase
MRTRFQPRGGSLPRETGHRPDGDAIALGNAKQPGGKIVHVWAMQGDWDANALQSNIFEMEWPPRSGKRQTFPELDRAAWFGLADARVKVLKGQVVFIDRLVKALQTKRRVIISCALFRAQEQHL